nr:hypothetical protein Itr_chr11CG15740 [Ipomoea trifida]GLL39716.1 hypothetical protein Itr_chr11CG15750 [Ipomoea trifida]
MSLDAAAAWRTPRERESAVEAACHPRAAASPCYPKTPPGRRDNVVAAPCSVTPPSTEEGSCWPEVLTPPAGPPSSLPERKGGVTSVAQSLR